eukprot:GFKZ01014655.1.p1 GENE.GFKZ01014655.1~~GFKZ01014655.1.p1  ORF type:complete len:858 (+),score=135.79 GFKZ01014655.1:154-2574(+)
MRPRPTKARNAPSVHPDDVIKILIATDNHLGYLEKDPVRGDDSFRAFEEVLELAKSNRVDMLLLAGDLFHENKPSRNTIVRTMRMLRKHCFSPEGEVFLAVRSDHTPINYMDPCVAVSLPVFVIHGNHDDPTGGVGPDALSALDLLESAGLITYFGKAVSSKKIQIAPVLLQKGQTGLALYGLGNIRDEILYDTWAKQKRVKWLSPVQPGSRNNSRNSIDANDSDEYEVNNQHMRWFNLFVLHQNRVTRGSARGISETLLPPWLDYVVWGHEHDSFPDLTLSKPPIVQPGSTVATSLSEGESKQKHAVLLEVYKGKLKHRPVPLYTTRYFEFQDLVLSQQEGLSETDPDGVVRFLENTVNEMVARQETLFDNKVSGFRGGMPREEVSGVRYPPRSYYEEKLDKFVRKPLVRLRVEISGNWEMPNPQRFGQRYVGRVACPSEMLLFYRSKRRPLKKSRTFLQGEAVLADGESDEDDPDRPSLSQGDGGQQDVVQIPRLVQYFLFHRQAGGTGLKFLELDQLTGAVDQFVTKQKNQAIPDYVTSYLKKQQDRTLRESDAGKIMDDEELLERFKNEALAAANRTLLDQESKDQNDDEQAPNQRAGGGESIDEIVANRTPEVQQQEKRIEDGLEDVHALLSNNPKIAAAAAASRVARVGLKDDDDDVPFETSASRATRLRGRGRGRGRGRSSSSSQRTPIASRKPPLSSTRRSARKQSLLDSDDEVVPVEDEAPKEQVEINDSDGDYVPVASSRKRRAQASASGSRSSSRPRHEAPASSQLRRSVFSSRARTRRNTATIDLNEESGDDAM